MLISTCSLLPADAAVQVQFSNSLYQPSRRTMQCNGSESTLLECLVSNATINIYHTTAVYVNCTSRILHPSPSIKTSSTLIFSETANIKTSSPVPKPSQSSSSTTEISPYTFVEETGSKCRYTHDDMVMFVSVAVGATILLVLVFIVLLTTVLIIRNRWKAAFGAISAREDANTTAIVLERNEAYMTSIQATRNEAYGVSPLVGCIVSTTEADYVSIHSTPDAPNNEDTTDPTRLH